MEIKIDKNKILEEFEVMPTLMGGLRKIGLGDSYTKENGYTISPDDKVYYDRKNQTDESAERNDFLRNDHYDPDHIYPEDQ